MKKKLLRKAVSGIAVLLTAVIFTLAGCENAGGGPGGGGDGGDEGGGSLVISGTLSSAQNRRFSRAVDPAATQTFSVKLGSDNKTLSGKLTDGSITFELSGEYDAVTKVFSIQAPSSFMIFSIVGKLDAGDAIDTASTSASVKLKDEVSGEWTNTDLTVTASSQTIDSAVNADTDDVSSIPAYCRGTFTDQILSGDDYTLKYMVTKNSITMYDGDYPPLDFTVVEITNANGSPADESGPWHLIVQGKWRIPNGALKDYTGKFYVGKTFEGAISDAIGNAPISDLYFGQNQNSDPLSTAVSTLPSGIKMFVTPYCADSADVLKGNENSVYPDDGYSPMFTGAQATANAKAEGNILKAKSGFVLALN